MEVFEISQKMELLDTAVTYFWKCWGNEDNFNFYRDCIVHSVDKNKALPKFYTVLNDKEIIASYALLTNDIISRQDLYPWLACLYVNQEHRNKGIAELLLNHGLEETHKRGFDRLYLSSDLENFYERKGWTHISNGYNIFDTEIKIYSKLTSKT